MLRKKLGEKIKAIRKSKRISQVKFAEILQMEPSNLCKIEHGLQMPKEENIEKIAEAFNIEIKELFDF